MKKAMKKSILMLMIIALIGTFTFSPALAAETDDSIIQVETVGDYIILTTLVKTSPKSRSSNTISTISGIKGKQIQDKNGNVLCKFLIEATFSVTQGSNATCTAKKAYGESISSYWKVEDISTRFINNTTAKIGGAEASGIFQKRFLGIPIESHSVTVTLQCDRYGNLF